MTEQQIIDGLSKKTNYSRLGNNIAYILSLDSSKTMAWMECVGYRARAIKNVASYVVNSEYKSIYLKELEI